MKSLWFNVALMLLPVLTLSACGGGDKAEDATNGNENVVMVTTQKAKVSDMPLWLETVGRIHARSAPALAAEVDGRITRVTVDTGEKIHEGQLLAEIDKTARLLQQEAAKARIERLTVHIANGERRVERLQKLSEKNLTSQSQLDDATEQLAAFRADYKAAQAELEIINDSLAKSSIIAPLTGVIQQRLVTEGDFVSRGNLLFNITRPEKLQAWLPFAETLALRVRVGQQARIYSPLIPGEVIKGVVTELQPALGTGSRALMAIVDIDEPGKLRPEATISGEVKVETHDSAVMVPAISIVRRPAGNVVYVIDGDTAYARKVVTGQHLNGDIEVAEGLDGSETIAVEGAAFLTDGAKITITESAP